MPATTTKPPTEPGFRWARLRKGDGTLDQWEVVEVVRILDDGSVHWFGGGIGNEGTDAEVGLWGTERLEPPSEG